MIFFNLFIYPSFAIKYKCFISKFFRLWYFCTHLAGSRSVYVFKFSFSFCNFRNNWFIHLIFRRNIFYQNSFIVKDFFSIFFNNLNVITSNNRNKICFWNRELPIVNVSYIEGDCIEYSLKFISYFFLT